MGPHTRAPRGVGRVTDEWAFGVRSRRTGMVFVVSVVSRAFSLTQVPCWVAGRELQVDGAEGM